MLHRRRPQIIIPKLGSKHGAYFAAYIASLASRVFVTVKLADIGGKSGGYFGARKWDQMFQGQAIFGCWCMVGAVTTSAMKYLEKRVALSVREILYKDSVERYLDPKELSYYRVDLVDPQARLTTDIEAYSREATHLLGHFFKPTIDVIHLAYVLTQRIGGRSLAIFLSFFYFSNFALTRVKNSLNKSLKQCAVETAELESALRVRHQKIHDAREQIALQRGTGIELAELQVRFKKLVAHLEATNRQYCMMDVLTTYILKYGGQMVGFSVLIPREYMTDPSLRSSADITAGFITESALLGALANAMKDLADSAVELPRVSGLATRVQMLHSKMQELPRMQATGLYKGGSEGGIVLSNVTIKAPPDSQPAGAQALLVEDLSVTIQRNQHTVIRGRNGVGKTSLFRVLGGLW